MSYLPPASFLQKHHVFSQTELCRADLGFIFGNRNIVQELAQEAARLYHRGYFPKILIAGGVETSNGICEADATAHVLLSLGVKKEDIWLERESAHTGENVVFSLPVIERNMGLENLRSVIGFGHFYAGPRFLMTLARHCPDLHAMHKSVFPAGHDHTNWHKDIELLDRALAERRKIPSYLAQGFISPVDIPLLNEKTRFLQLHQTPRTPAPQYAFK